MFEKKLNDINAFVRKKNIDAVVPKGRWRELFFALHGELREKGLDTSEITRLFRKQGFAVQKEG